MENMDVSANEYLPGDQRLVEKIVYELKSQGIFDQFRKECFADVDTKPAYQNLRQRVEGSVSNFLKEQSWRPDMNKNQVREMLRKTIFELGFLETGVERIVDQVVNPKINSVFLPKVEEVVYRYLGVQKPGRSDEKKPKQIIEPVDLLPTDLEAVSPESDHGDKKEEQEKSNDSTQNLDDSKVDEDESPPFEPLDEPILPHEENSVDSHFSGYSGLVSHESGNDSKILDLCLQESQMSQNSSDSRLSTLASDENSKMDICEDTSKSGDFTKDKGKESHKSSSEKNRSQSDKDKDRKRSRDGKSGSSRDRSRDSKVSSKSDDKDRRDKRKSESDRNKGSSSSTNRHSSSGNKSTSSKEKSDTHRHDRDKYDKNRSHKDRDSKGKDRNSDSKLKSSTSKRDDKYHSSSKKDKSYKKKDKDPKDDHYSLKNKIVDRRSTDRDSDGQSSKYSFSSSVSQSNSQSQNNNGQEQSSSNGNGNGDPVDQGESSETKMREQRLKVTKPKYASNMQEAMKLMKIRRQLARLEKQNQLSLATVEVNSTLMSSSSISLDDLTRSHEQAEKNKLKDMNNKIVAELETVPTPLPNTVISQNNWDEMEAKLLKEVCSEFSEVGRDDSFEERQEIKETDVENDEAANQNVKGDENMPMSPRATADEEKSETIVEEKMLETEEKILEAEKEMVVTNEEKNVVEAKEDEAVEAKENKAVEAKADKAVEAKEEKAVEAKEEKAVEAKEEKAVEAKEEKVIEAKEEKAIEADKEKTGEANEEKTVEAGEGRSVEAGKGNAVEANEEKAIETSEGKIIGGHKENTVKSGEEKVTNAVENMSAVASEETIAEQEDDVCKYFEEVDISKIEFLQFVKNFLKRNEDVSNKCTVKDTVTKEISLKRKLETTNNNNNMTLGTGMPQKKQKVISTKKTKKGAAVIDEATDKIVPLTNDALVNGNEVSRPKTKSKIVTKAANNQRYSSDDLYKPRPSFSSSRRRGPKSTNI